MEKTKAHGCPSCGGLLKVNEDRRMYECTFCGMTFDYEYFREDDVLSRGRTMLKRGEFFAADEAFEFMLDKDPHNYEALTGSILAAGRISSVGELGKTDKYLSFAYDHLDERIDRAIRDADPRYKDQFVSMKGLFASGREYRQAVTELDGIEADRKDLATKLHKLEVKRRADDTTDEDHAADFVRWGIALVAAFLLGLIVLACRFRAWVWLLILVPSFLIPVCVSVVNGIRGYRDIKSLRDEIDHTESRIKELENGYNDLGVSIGELRSKVEMTKRNVSERYRDMKKQMALLER